MKDSSKSKLNVPRLLNKIYYAQLITQHERITTTYLRTYISDPCLSSADPFAVPITHEVTDHLVVWIRCMYGKL